MLRQLAYGFTIPLLWAMMADVADYSEWKNRRRATAIVFSAIVFGLKAGLGFGGAIGGWVLSAYGYVPNVDQTERALQGIRLTASLFPAATFLISVVCLFFYQHRQAPGDPDNDRTGRAAEGLGRRACRRWPHDDAQLIDAATSCRARERCRRRSGVRAGRRAPASRPSRRRATLKDVSAHDFMIGAATRRPHFNETDASGAPISSRRSSTRSRRRTC